MSTIDKQRIDNTSSDITTVGPTNNPTLRFNTTAFSSDDEENDEGSDEDIEVEAEIEEDDPVTGRQDELTGLQLLASR